MSDTMNVFEDSATEIGYDHEKTQRKLDLVMSNLRSKLLLNSPFYGECLVRLGNARLLTPEEAIRMRVFTAATDGIRIIFAPSFVNELSVAELNFVILHEMYHILMLHALRFKNLDVNSKKCRNWNIACDYIINYLISAAIPEFASFDLDVKFAEGGLLKVDEDGNLTDLSDKSAEDLFAELEDKENSEDNDNQNSSSNEDNQDNQDSSNNSGLGNENNQDDSKDAQSDSKNSEGDKDDSDNGSDDSDDELNDLRSDLQDEFDDDLPVDQSEIESLVEEVMKDIANKNYSDTPGYIKRKIELELKKPKLRWDKYLRRFLSSKLIDELTYDKPDKRYLNHGMIMAGMGAEADCINNLSIYFDTSGSISNDELIKFLSHAWKIADDYDCTLSIYLWHTELYGEYKDVSPDEFKSVVADINYQAGGTDVNCVLRYIRENDLKSTAYIILTDGYFMVPKLDNLGRKLSKKTMLALLDTRNYDKDLERLGKIVSLGEE